MGFRNSILGGINLIRAAIRSPNYVSGSTGWTVNQDGSAEFNNVTIRGGTVVGGTALYYNGTPALGNLIMSIAATAGTDPYGNAYVAGVGVYGTSDAVTVRSSGGDTAVLRADAPSGISDTPAPGLVLTRSSGDAAGGSLTEWDDTFQRGLYLRAPSPVADPDALEGVDYAALRATGRYYSQDPEIQMVAGDPVDAPDGRIVLNGSVIDAGGEITTYAPGAGWHSYTPTITGAGGATYTTRVGYYRRVGDMVQLIIYVVVATAGAGATAITINAPTDIDRTTRQVMTAYAENITAGLEGPASLIAFDTGSGAAFGRLRSARTNANVTAADLLAGASIVAQGWYREG